MGEAQLGKEVGDEGTEVGGGGFEEGGGEEEGFGDGEEREGVVVLGDVGGELAKGGGEERGGIDREGAVGGEGSGGENVQEGGLPGAAGANDGEDLGRVGGEGDVLEDVSWRGGGAMVEEGRKFGGGGFGVAY
ncbi:hypothetical protein V8G54_029853 [Vigna mungo]|uniref:Uncharacterized protein n=1 Tax=Vigna mungo TaxID=3915 RepID=A0AAQ3MV38_VIGMU